MSTNGPPRPLSWGAQKVFAVLSQNAARDGTVTMSRSEIAAQTGLQAKAITAATERLAQNGYLTVEHVLLPKPLGRQKNRYRLNGPLFRAELDRQSVMGEANQAAGAESGMTEADAAADAGAPRTS